MGIKTSKLEFLTGWGCFLFVQAIPEGISGECLPNKAKTLAHNTHTHTHTRTHVLVYLSATALIFIKAKQPISMEEQGFSEIGIVSGRIHQREVDGLRKASDCR